MEIYRRRGVLRSVFRAVEFAVEWGRSRMDLTGITAIGVDEVMWQKGHKHLTLVYQIDGHCKRLLWIGQNRSEETIKAFFPGLHRHVLAN